MIDEKHLEKILMGMFKTVIDNPCDEFYDGYYDAIRDIRNEFLPNLEFKDGE